MCWQCVRYRGLDRIIYVVDVDLQESRGVTS